MPGGEMDSNNKLFHSTTVEAVNGKSIIVSLYISIVLRYKSEGHGFYSRLWQWNFSMAYSFQPHWSPRIDTASNWNEYQEYFLEVKAAGVWGWQAYHIHVPVFLKSRYLKLLDSSGPLQAYLGVVYYIFESIINCLQGGSLPGLQVALSKPYIT
jgi:hypothetical protein